MSESKKIITETTEEAKEPAPAVQQTGQVETLAYVGPTIVGVASHNTIFNNGLPNALKLAMEKEPAFRGLVIPINKLASALKEIDTKLGATFSLYEKVANYKSQEDKQ